MALFDDLRDEVEKRAQAVAERTRDAVEAAWAQFPDIMVRREGDTIVLSGRGLMRRWLGDARLRFSLGSRR